MKKYPDVKKSALNPALHYVRIGYVKKHRPSLYFDPEFYLQEAPEAVGSGIAPLVHYLKAGRAAGKRPSPLYVPPVTPSLQGIMRDAASPDSHTRTPSADWIRHRNLTDGAGEFGLSLGGVLIARFDREEHAGAWADQLAAFCKLMRIDVTEDLRLTNGLHTESVFMLGALNPSRFSSFGPELTSGTTRLVDAWFANDVTLRLRFEAGPLNRTAPYVVVRGFQVDPATGVAALVGESAVNRPGLPLAEFTLNNPLLPVLLVVTTADGRTIEMGVLPFPSLCRGGLHYAELAAYFDLSNFIDDLRLKSDIYIRALFSANLGAEASTIGQVAVRVEGATGAERIFSPSVLEWLVCIFGVQVVPATTVDHTSDAGSVYLYECLSQEAGIRPALRQRVPRHERSLAGLVLPPNALPTISSLVLLSPTLYADVSAAVGSFLVAEAATCRPRWSVYMPAMGSDLLALQPNGPAIPYPVLSTGNNQGSAGSTQGDVKPWQGLHLAIRYQSMPSWDDLPLTSNASDASAPILHKASGARDAQGDSVTVVVTCTDETRARQFMWAMSRQTRDFTLSVVAVVPTDLPELASALKPELDALFPGQYTFLQARGDHWENTREALRTYPSRFVLLTDDFIVLHDVRTLATLVTIVSSKGVASSSCVIYREAQVKKKKEIIFLSGGLLPSQINPNSSSAITLALENTLEAFPNATYPIAAPAFQFALIDSRLLEQWLSRDAQERPDTMPNVHFGIWALSTGRQHFCTSTVRATSVRPINENENHSSFDRDVAQIEGWERLHASSAALRELNG